MQVRFRGRKRSTRMIAKDIAWIEGLSHRHHEGPDGRLAYVRAGSLFVRPRVPIKWRWELPFGTPKGRSRDIPADPQALAEPLAKLTGHCRTGPCRRRLKADQRSRKERRTWRRADDQKVAKNYRRRPDIPICHYRFLILLQVAKVASDFSRLRHMIRPFSVARKPPVASSARQISFS